MKKVIAVLAILLAFLLGTSGFSYSQATGIEELVDNFQKATDLQRDQIIKDNLNKDISGSGSVSNAGQYDFFDTANDFRGTYYQVITNQQKTKNNTPYQVMFLFKDKSKAEGINKDQPIQKDGKIIRITDERLQISLWILCDDLTDADKQLLNQD